MSAAEEVTPNHVSHNGSVSETYNRILAQTCWAQNQFQSAHNNYLHAWAVWSTLQGCLHTFPKLESSPVCPISDDVLPGSQPADASTESSAILSSRVATTQRQNSNELPSKAGQVPLGLDQDRERFSPSPTWNHHLYSDYDILAEDRTHQRLRDILLELVDGVKDDPQDSHKDWERGVTFMFAHALSRAMGDLKMDFNG